MLLNLLPIDPQFWEDEMKDKRELYVTYSDLFTPSKTESDESSGGSCGGCDAIASGSLGGNAQTDETEESEHKNKDCWKEYSFTIQVCMYLSWTLTGQYITYDAALCNRIMIWPSK
jgi:hypothetical protein